MSQTENSATGRTFHCDGHPRCARVGASVRVNVEGAHDSERDAVLLAYSDEGDPNSPLSFAKEGKLLKGRD